LTKASFLLGGISTGASIGQTALHIEHGNYADATVTGADSAVGAAMLTGAPPVVAFGLGYFGVRLVDESIGYLTEFFRSEPKSLLDGL
jgi:hypothetical protein